MPASAQLESHHSAKGLALLAVFLISSALLPDVVACPEHLIGSYQGVSYLTVAGLVFVGGCQPCQDNPGELCDYDSSTQELTPNPCEPAFCGEDPSSPARIVIADVGGDDCEVTVTPDDSESCLGGADGSTSITYTCQEIPSGKTKQNKFFTCETTIFGSKQIIVDVAFTGMNMDWMLSGQNGNELYADLGGLEVRMMYGNSGKNRGLLLRGGVDIS